jgi:hypothetical protein
MPPLAGGEGMTGNRPPGSPLPSHYGRWRTRPTTTSLPLLPGAPILRRSEPASRPGPLTRVDLQSSLDPNPSLAYARTEPGNREEPVTTRSDSGVDTAPPLQG